MLQGGGGVKVLKQYTMVSDTYIHAQLKDIQVKYMYYEKVAFLLNVSLSY